MGQMDARLRFQLLMSVLLIVLFIEFYSKVGPEVALDTTLSFLIRNLVLRKGISQTRVKQNKKVEGKKNVNMI